MLSNFEHEINSMAFHVPNESHKGMIRRKKKNGEKNLLLSRQPEEKNVRAVVFEPGKDLFLRPSNLFFPLARKAALGLLN